MPLNAVLLRKFLTFSLVGGVVFVFDASCFWALIQVTALPTPSRVISVGLAMTLSWWLNRRYTFRTQDRPRVKELLRFILSQLPGACINALCSLLAFHYLPYAENNPWLSTAVGSCAGLIANFASAQIFVFNKTRRG